ncbi:MAG TPA: hypothetical protein VGC97_06300 [Pyrinomonadaceae bacterium]|jgi:hypothetical protein
MRVFKLSILFFIAALFITACNKVRTPDSVYNQPDDNQQYEIGRAEGGFLDEEDILEARENLDLQAVGSLLERANNAEDFEYLLNSENSINNLDLNDDGYADYISVREFDDRYDDERGFSLFSQFGPDLIQEIATIIFDRNGYRNDYYPGSNVLIRGNDYIYGDDYYYETNWRDRQVPFVTWVFSDRDGYYQSPYYYQNYPSYYEPYPIVETTVYETRIEQYYSSPVFIQTAQPSITQVKIASPYTDKSLNRVYATLPPETRQRFEVQRNNPKPANYERVKRENAKLFAGREDREVRADKQSRQDRQFNDKQNQFDRPEKLRNEKQQQVSEMREKPNKPERVNEQPQNQQKFERQNQQRVERQQQKPERPQQQQQQQRVERQNQPKVERQQQIRVEKQQQRQQMRIEKPQQQVRQQPQQMRQPPQQQKQQTRPQPNGNGGGKQNGGGGNPNKGGGNPNNGGGKGKGKP